MTVLRGAIVGFGSVAQYGHWPGYRDQAALEIVAAVDPSAERRAVAGTMTPAPRVYASIDELARRETIDFVDICTPPSAHAELAATALRQRWHVLCEKPLTLDAGEYRRLRALTSGCARTLVTVHNWKAAPILQAALGEVARGTIGAVRHVDVFTWRSTHCAGAVQGAGASTAGAPEDWRLRKADAGGGILVDHGWHAFYLAMAFTSAVPTQVQASLHVADGPEALEDTVDAVVRFPDAEACIHLTWQASVRRNLIVVRGDRGTVVIDDDRLLVTTWGHAWHARRFDTPLSGGSHHADWFRPLLEAFREEIENPAIRGANLREAGWCVALTEAAYRSGRENGRIVDVQFPE